MNEMEQEFPITITHLTEVIMENTIKDEGLCKIRLVTQHPDFAERIMERVWAKPLGDDRYQLKNDTLHGLAYDDVVYAPVEHGIPTHTRMSN